MRNKELPELYTRLKFTWAGFTITYIFMYDFIIHSMVRAFNADLREAHRYEIRVW